MQSMDKKKQPMDKKKRKQPSKEEPSKEEPSKEEPSKKKDRDLFDPEPLSEEERHHVMMLRAQLHDMKIYSEGPPTGKVLYLALSARKTTWVDFERLNQPPDAWNPTLRYGMVGTSLQSCVQRTFSGSVTMVAFQPSALNMTKLPLYYCHDTILFNLLKQIPKESPDAEAALKDYRAQATEAYNMFVVGHPLPYPAIADAISTAYMYTTKTAVECFFPDAPLQLPHMIFTEEDRALIGLIKNFWPESGPLDLDMR
jgi:hypothetical protein